MFASPRKHQKPGTSPVLYTLRRYLTMRVLATALFIAFAVLASIGGKETQTKQPLFDKSSVGDLTLRHQNQGGCAAATKPSTTKSSQPTLSSQSPPTTLTH